MRPSAHPLTVDLAAYPDLVVIYLGMRVNAFAGIKTLLGLGPQIDQAGAAAPDGLLLYENNIIFKFYPLHVGMRWYWRDFESMERWTRSEPHRKWWKDFVRDSGGTGFWHEVYAVRGGMEGIYSEMTGVGFAAFAPTQPAQGSLLSARRRLGLTGDAPPPPTDAAA
ncbi:MAG: phenylacetaldoxime dehydratase family protein [Methylovirgula sp.]